MKKVSVIGMDLGDKNHKAVGLAEDGTVVDRSRKNDWHDAEMLARVARTDRTLFAPVRLRSDENQGLMRLVKARDLLVRNRTAIVNETRGFCKAEGAGLPKCSAESFARMEYEVPACVRAITKPLFAVLRELVKKIALYDKSIADATRKLYPAELALLEPIGGVGPITAAAFLAAIEDPATFGSALAIAANHILGPFGKDSDLRRHGLQIAARGGKNARKRAKVAVARKLAEVATRRRTFPCTGQNVVQ